MRIKCVTSMRRQQYTCIRDVQWHAGLLCQTCTYIRLLQGRLSPFSFFTEFTEAVDEKTLTA